MTRDRTSAAQAPPDSEELAAQAFARRRFGPWENADESELEIRLERDPAFADAFRRVEQSWTAVGQHATSAELMALREHAISRARRANARRWTENTTGRGRMLRIAASIAAVGIILAAAYQFAPFGFRPGEYRTNVGEQRAIELADHTRIALDAATRVRVHFSKESRIVKLMQGQAQFSVAKDSARPFKVQAGTHTVVAVGTVFTVEYVDRKMHVAMLEGKVAVLGQIPSQAPVVIPGAKPDPEKDRDRHPVRRSDRPSPGIAKRATPPWDDGEIYLSAGEELRVAHDGQATFNVKADLEAATAWREGKVIFHSEPLSEAVRRLNRYSRLQLQVDDPKLAAMNISGVFDTGDTAAFVEAVQSYLPAAADYSDRDIVRLKAK